MSDYKTNYDRIDWSWAASRVRPSRVRVKSAALSDFPSPQVNGDIPEYLSPVTGLPVDGRAARREDLKRSGCREVDPSEFQPTYKNEKNLKKYSKGKGEVR